MKIGCAAWCFTAPQYQAPYEDAVRIIGRMGFDAIELIAHNIYDVQQYYTDDTIRGLKDLIQSYNMEISQFAIYTELTQGLASMEESVRRKSIADFEKMVKIGYRLGAPMINMVSNWINGFRCQVSYVPNYWAPFAGGAPFAEATQNMKLPEQYDGEKIWEQYMKTLKKCLENWNFSGVALMAKCSFGIYLLHKPIMILCERWIVPDNINLMFKIIMLFCLSLLFSILILIPFVLKWKKAGRILFYIKG